MPGSIEYYNTFIDTGLGELSTIQVATMKGVGNVTNLATWINTYKTAKIFYAVGKEIKLRHSHYSHSPSTIQFCHTSLA